MTMASGVYGGTLRDCLDASALGVKLDGTNTIRNALFEDLHTPDFDGDTQWSMVDNEVSGTGYTTKGATITSPTIAATGGVLTFDGTDTSWGPGATIADVRGRIVLDDTTTNDNLIVATTFGADYAVTNGTLTVQESGSGIWTLDYTP